MSILDDLLGRTSADASNQAAADTYAKQLAASNATRSAGADYQNNVLGLAGAYSPYVSAGNSALTRLMGGLGLNGAGGSADFANAYRSLPGYQAGLDTGTNAALRGANASGMSNSGRALKALQRFGSDYEDQKSGDYLNRLTALQGQGLGATQAQTGLQAQGYGGGLQANLAAGGQDYGSAGTVGQGMVAGAQAKQTALSNILGAGSTLLGSALGGPIGKSAGSVGGSFLGNLYNNFRAA